MTKKNNPPAKKAKSKSPSKARKKTKEVEPQPIRMAEEVTEKIVADSMRKIGGGGNVSSFKSVVVSETKLEAKNLQAQQEWLVELTNHMENIYRLDSFFRDYRHQKINDAVWPKERVKDFKILVEERGDFAFNRLRDVYIALEDQPNWDVKIPWFLKARTTREVVPAKDAVIIADWFVMNAGRIGSFSLDLDHVVRNGCLLLRDRFECWYGNGLWGHDYAKWQEAWRAIPRLVEYYYLGRSETFKLKTIHGDFIREVSTKEVGKLADDHYLKVCYSRIQESILTTDHIPPRFDPEKAQIFRDTFTMYKSWDVLFQWWEAIGKDLFKGKKGRDLVENALSVVWDYKSKGYDLQKVKGINSQVDSHKIYLETEVRQEMMRKAEKEAYDEAVARDREAKIQAHIKVLPPSEHRDKAERLLAQGKPGDALIEVVKAHDSTADAPKGDGSSDDIMIEDSDSVEEQRRKKVDLLLRFDFKGKTSLTYAEIGKYYEWEPRSSYVKKKPLEYMKDANGNYLTKKRKRKDGTLFEEKIPVTVLHKTDMCEAARKLVKKWKLKPTRARARPPKFSCQKVAKKIAEDEFPE
jgi:hypothetical protein